MAVDYQIRQAVESLFEVVPSRSTVHEIAFICPEPGCGDKSGNRSVNIRTGKTSCWRCGKGGDFKRWAARLGFTVEYDDMPSVKVSELATILDTLESDAPRATGFSTGVPLPRGFVSLADEPDSVFSKWIGRMAVRKQLTLEDFVRAGVGFTRDDALWEPFAIFPVVEWGKTVYYQGRTYNEDPGEKTKRFPSRTECPMSSRYWVYNIDELRLKGGIAIIVESILNVLSLKRELEFRGITGCVPIAVFKHSISREQAAKIIACKGLKEICMMYDDDALPSIYKECHKLVNNIKITYVKMPRKVDANDDARLAVDLFEKRQRYSHLQMFSDKLA